MTHGAKAVFGSYLEPKTCLAQDINDARCLSLTDAGSLMLREAGGTLASEASNGVDAQELAVMLLSRAFIQIFGHNENGMKLA